MSEGYKKVCRFIGSHNLSAGDRQKDDFYATAPMAAECLIKIEDLNKFIWEPACGKGHLAKVFDDHDYVVLATDKIYRGYGVGGVDFLMSDLRFDGDIVTNPPFSLAQKFIEHGLQLVTDGSKVCMLLRVQFLEGKARKVFFAKYPPKTVWVSSSRIKCGKNGNFSEAHSMMALAWFVWEKGYKGDTVIRWFN